MRTPAAVTSPLPDLAAAAREVLDALSHAGHRACLIGGLAVSRWGEPRATTDVDISVLAPSGDEGSVIDSILREFAQRASGAREFAMANRVLLIRATNAVAVDVALAAFPFEVEALDAASDWELAPGIVVRTCSAEHLVVYKLVAARTRDLLDVETVVRRQGAKLDVALVRRWGTMFADVKEDPDLLRPFEDVLRKARPDR